MAALFNCNPPPPPFLATPGPASVPWRQWKLAFLNYLEAIGGEDLTQRRRKAILLNALGLEGQRIYYSLAPLTASELINVHMKTEPDSDVFDEAISLLDKHFATSVNELMERHRFRQRRQLPGEPFEAYAAALRELAASCDFGDQMEKAVRDQLLEGSTSQQIRERLLFEGTSLTLSRAVELGKHIEQTRHELKELSADSVVQRIVDKPERRSASGFSACYRCGSTEHRANARECRAKKVKCRNCNKVGHFASVCRSRRPGESQGNTESKNTPEATNAISVLNLSTEGMRGKGIYIDVNVNNTTLSLLIDTGSSVSLLNEASFQEHFSGCSLTDAKVRLVDYSKQRIAVKGCFLANVAYKQVQTCVLFHVVERGTSLLGLDAIQNLQLCIEGDTLSCLQTDSQPSSLLPAHLRGEFSHLFSGKLGQVKGFVHEVKVRPSVKPVAAKLRRLPLALRERVSAELRQLELSGIIERVDAAEWVSAIVVVQKPNGTIRLCVDLREVNKAIIVDGFPLPHTEELLHHLVGATRFSKLDLKAAYHQLELTRESRELTTFVTHEGLFRFRRVCFGLASAPAAFQKLMSSILKGCQGVLCYIDDVVVWGKTASEHDENLREVLKRISNAGLTLNEKCVFDVDQISFLGHVVSSEGIAPMHSKVEAVTQAAVPKDAPALRSFLGLAGYYARFVPHYADVVEPLRKLLRKQQAFVWDEAAQHSFDAVKAALSSCSVIHMFDPELPVVVTTDASNTGLGAVLQQQAGKELRTVAFASRSLTSAERKYSAGEKEALACLFACEHWHVYLWGRRFLLRTDHQALVTLMSSGGAGRRPLRIARWSARLLYYNFDIVYQKGSDNVVADALSRLAVTSAAEPELDEEVVSVVLSCITKGQLQAATAESETLQTVIKYIASGWPAKKILSPEVKPYHEVKEELSVIDNIVFRGDRIVVPETLTSELVVFAHDTHPGITRTKQRLRGKFWWPRMDTEVEHAVRSCHTCQAADKSAKPTNAPLQPVAFPELPWQKLAIDIVGPLNLQQASPRFVITLIDYHSKWPEVYFANTVTSEVVIDFLTNVFSREGYPEEIISDNGPQFKSQVFENFLKERGIKHGVSSVYYPQANGLVERFNRSLKDFIQLSVLEGRCVQSTVVEYLAVYRATPHSTTGVSPSVLLHRRQPRTRLDIVGLPSKEFFQEPALAMRRLRARVQAKQMSMKTYTDERRAAKAPKFREGDYVRVRTQAATGKAGRSYSKPRRIVKQLGPNSFRLEDGRTWNASKLVSVPEQCQIGRNQQSPSALPTEEDPDPCGADDSQLPLQATTPTRSPPLSSSCQPPNCPSVVTSRGPSTRDRRLPSRFRDFYV